MMAGETSIFPDPAARDVESVVGASIRALEARFATLLASSTAHSKLEKSRLGTRFIHVVRGQHMNAKQPLSQQGREAYSGRIKNFSKERYISGDWYEREWRAMWSKSWIAAVHVSDVTDPGDYVVFDLGRESILLTCNGDGTVQAFYNVCQHRGVRLVDDHSGQYRELPLSLPQLAVWH